MILLVSLGADALATIAAPAYASAALLIPIIAVGTGANAVFRGLYRAVGFPRRRYWYVALHIIWLGPFAAACVGLSAFLEVQYAVALSGLVAGVFVCIAFVVLDRRGPEPTPFPWARLGLALAVAALCVTVARTVPLDGLAHAAVAILAAAAFVPLLVVVGALTRDQVRVTFSILAKVIPRRVSPGDLERRLAALPVHERRAITLMACERRSPSSAAQRLGIDEPLARLARGLRRYTGSAQTSSIDAAIGEYVLHRGTTLERDHVAAQLIQDGVDPLDLHVLEDAMREIRRARRRGRRQQRGLDVSTAG